ncbi:hypothetical protein [Azonexus sp.]|nr:hypothetical protein [Azonexus sp.]
MQHKHDYEVKQGRYGEFENAAALVVDRNLASVEPGDGFVVL